jgi:hypothetical protein
MRGWRAAAERGRGPTVVTCPIRWRGHEREGYAGHDAWQTHTHTYPRFKAREQHWKPASSMVLSEAEQDTTLEMPVVQAVVAFGTWVAAQTAGERGGGGECTRRRGQQPQRQGGSQATRKHPTATGAGPIRSRWQWARRMSGHTAAARDQRYSNAGSTDRGPLQGTCRCTPPG